MEHFEQIKVFCTSRMREELCNNILSNFTEDEDWITAYTVGSEFISWEESTREVAAELNRYLLQHGATDKEQVLIELYW